MAVKVRDTGVTDVASIGGKVFDTVTSQVQVVYTVDCYVNSITATAGVTIDIAASVAAATNTNRLKIDIFVRSGTIYWGPTTTVAGVGGPYFVGDRISIVGWTGAVCMKANADGGQVAILEYNKA